MFGGGRSHGAVGSRRAAAGRSRSATGVVTGIVLFACAVSAAGVEPGDLQIRPLKPFPAGLTIPALELAPMSPGSAWTSVGKGT